MRTRILMAIACVLLAAGNAAAVPVVTAGTINPAVDPTMPVVFITPDNCTGQGAFPVHYDAYALTVDVAGSYTFSQTSTGGFASLYLFDATFNPAAAFPSCLAGDNGPDPVGFTEALSALTTYYVVPFDDTFPQLGGAYTLTIDGPGTARLLAVPEPGVMLLVATGIAAGWRRRRARV